MRFRNRPTPVSIADMLLLACARISPCLAFQSSSVNFVVRLPTVYRGQQRPGAWVERALKSVVQLCPLKISECGVRFVSETNQAYPLALFPFTLAEPFARSAQEQALYTNVHLTCVGTTVLAHSSSVVLPAESSRLRNILRRRYSRSYTVPPAAEAIRASLSCRHRGEPSHSELLEFIAR